MVAASTTVVIYMLGNAERVRVTELGIDPTMLKEHTMSMLMQKGIETMTF